MLLVFFGTYQETVVLGHYPTIVGGTLFHGRNDRGFGTKRVSVSLDELLTILLSGFEDGLLSLMRGRHTDILDAIRTSRDLTAETEAKLKDVVASYAKSFS